MQEEQMEVLRDLEAVFKRAKAAGLVFIGVEMELYAYDKVALRIAEKKVIKETKEASLYRARKRCEKEKNAWPVNDHNTYLDSETGEEKTRNSRSTPR